VNAPVAFFTHATCTTDELNGASFVTTGGIAALKGAVELFVEKITDWLKKVFGRGGRQYTASTLEPVVNLPEALHALPLPITLAAPLIYKEPVSMS
jgi:hypothetical protein